MRLTLFGERFLNFLYDFGVIEGTFSDFPIESLISLRLCCRNFMFLNYGNSFYLYLGEVYSYGYNFCVDVKLKCTALISFFFSTSFYFSIPSVPILCIIYYAVYFWKLLIFKIGCSEQLKLSIDSELSSSTWRNISFLPMKEG